MAAMIGLGFLGFGVQGRRMASRLPEHGGARAVAAWDPDPASVAGSGIAVAASAEALVATRGVDCVFIASPPRFHMAQANLAFDAGKAVFCEKPLAVDAEEARTTIERIGREGHRAAVNFSLAASAGLAALLSAVERREAGALRAIELEVAFKAWPRPWQSAAGRWLAGREEGGFTREVLSHFVFALQRALGKAVVEKSEARYPGDGAGAETGLSARLRAGAIPVEIEGRVGGEIADFNRFALVGDRTTIAFTEWLGKRDGQPVDAGGRLAYLRQLDELVAFIEGRPHRLPDFAEALAVQETIEALLN
jgi:predicted dehydrogenase